jgi:predicted MFS family arabinose efflux permease
MSVEAVRMDDVEKMHPFNRHVVLAFLSCMGLGVVFMNLAPVLPKLQAIYGKGSAGIALLATSIALGHAVVQIPAGMAIDAVGIKRTLGLSLAVILLSNLLCALHEDYRFVLGMRFVAGIGTGFAFLAAIKYATLFTATRYRGAVQGIFGASFTLGGIPPFLFVPALLSIDWRLIYVGTAAFFVIPLALLLLWGKAVGRGSGMQWSDYRPLFGNRVILALGFLHAVHLGGIITLGTWFTGFAVHLDPSRGIGMAAVLGGLVMLASGSARIVGGLLMKLFSPYRIILWSFVILLVCFAAISQIRGLGLAVPLYCLTIFFSSVTFGPIFYLSSAATGMELAATGFGIVNFVANVGSLVLPVVFGFFIDVSGAYALPFLFMAVMSLAGTFVTLVLRIMPADPAGVRTGR